MIKSIEEMKEKEKLLEELKKKLSQAETDESVSDEEYWNLKQDCEDLFEDIHGRTMYVDYYEGY